MKGQFSGFQLLLAHWIKSDTLLWSELEDGHVKLLYQRLVKEYSYEELAIASKLSTIQIKRLLEAVLSIIERSHGYLIADFLREINLGIESGKYASKIGKGGFEFSRIWLN